MALIDSSVTDFTPQPINSIVRDNHGTIFLPVDAKGAASVLFASDDDGKTWRDTGGRTGGRHTTIVLGKDNSLIGFGGKDSNIDGFMPKSISKDGGKTYIKSKTPFPALSSGQRPSMIRLASGRLFFVSDLIPRMSGAFVALSDDEGETWRRRNLPVNTVGYATAAQAPNGIIHLITSKTTPAPLHIELNEAWILSDAPAADYDATVRNPQSFSENYPSGKLKATWSGGLGGDNRFHLNGLQTLYYESGAKFLEINFSSGKKTGTETFWNPDGHKKWERIYDADGRITWRIFNSAGKVNAESTWNGKSLLDARFDK
jgi:hypothetical protein